MIKKNIIFPIEFDHLNGGMIQSTISIAKELAKDYNVYILAHRNAAVFGCDKQLKSLILEKPWSISFGTPIKTLSTYFEVRKLLKSFDANTTLVFTNNVGSELIFSGFGFFPIAFRRIFVSRGGSYLGKTGWIIRRGFKSVYHFIAISEHQKNILLKSGIKDKLITKIHNGVKSSEKIKIPQSNSKVVNLSIIGYINSNKNQLLAIETLYDLIKYYPNLKLNIYGLAFSETDKDYKQILLKRIVELGLEKEVLFRGFESDQSIIFQNTDILLSTSLSEGFGRSVAEAMGYGVPCIGLASSGGLLDIITSNHDGILIENDKTELFDAINNLITDITFRKNIISNALLTYNSKFTEEIMCNNYLNFTKQNLK